MASESCNPPGTEQTTKDMVLLEHSSASFIGSVVSVRPSVTRRHVIEPCSTHRHAISNLQVKLNCRRERALQRLAIVVFVPLNRTKVAFDLSIHDFAVLFGLQSATIVAFHCSTYLAVVTVRLSSSEIWRKILKLNAELFLTPP